MSVGISNVNFLQNLMLHPGICELFFITFDYRNSFFGEVIAKIRNKNVVISESKDCSAVSTVSSDPFPKDTFFCCDNKFVVLFISRVGVSSKTF